MFKCAHISDVHFRSLKRHNEYIQVFNEVFDNLKKLNLDCIFIGGDIVHSKTQGITPELIDILNWWFTSLADIAPTHVILGNHDGLILNEDRQDAITPIVNALNNPNIFLYKKSGVYPFFNLPNGQQINWCVFSCFDEKGWENVKPTEDEINIACFHGAVTGSVTDINWELEGEVNLNFFKGYDFGFLGDIHKLQYLDEEKRVLYPGSTVQQNYGEDISKGFVYWEINSKNDYVSKFIKVSNPHPFLTLNWKGSVEETIEFASKVKKSVRFRVKSNESISQAEIKLLHYYLKTEKAAHEIVYQVVPKDDESKHCSSEEYKKLSGYNIRNSFDRKTLINEFYESLDQEVVNNLDKIFEKTLDKIPEDLKDVFGQKWSINNLSFDNTFSYGKDNFIDFDKMSGVVGIFGNNRAGKSSIPGTLMYTLFNTTDRGSLKNQDIVNIRKGFCNTKAKVTIGAEQYLIERETIKKTNKKDITTATTNLKLTSLNSFENESEEQRRETEKSLKKLIGTPEDFLYTTFASQGEMNTFINEKSSARRTVLSKFLNINIYDELYNNSREDYIYLKSRLNNAEEKNWSVLIEDAFKEIKENELKISLNEEEISEFRNDLIKLNIELNNVLSKTKKHASGHTLKTANEELSYNENKKQDNISKKSLMLEKILEIEENLEKINNFKENFSIEDLEEENKRIQEIEKKVINLKNTQKSENLKNNSYENEIKILDQVPCEDKFPNCKFIKKAHQAKKEIGGIKENINLIEGDILELTTVLRSLREKEIDSKINKYNSILKKEYKLSLDKENTILQISLKDKEFSIIKKENDNLINIINELKSLNVDQFINKELSIQEKIGNAQDNINNLNYRNLEINKRKFELERNIQDYNKEREEYNKLIIDFRLYDLFNHSVSKKGIPTMIINSFLPRINTEINNILNGVVSFNISIEEDEKGNNLNVYIDYGDSKRVIECASGMEKMMTSIAIRVALINISSLARSDIFIIDEGFGALDDSNIEACGRLLNSLKKYFKAIIVISHVDAIKDIVDKNIMISIKGKDSHVRFE